MPLNRHGPDSGSGSGFGIEIDIVGDEQVQMSVLVIIHERAAGIPAALPVAGIGGDPGLAGYIRELPLPSLCHSAQSPQ